MVCIAVLTRQIVRLYQLLWIYGVYSWILLDCTGLCNCVSGKAIPLQPWAGTECSGGFKDNRHMKVVRLSALRTGRLYHQEISLVPISVIGCVDLMAIVWREGSRQWKIPVAPPSEIEPATFLVLEQCLNQLCLCVPHVILLALTYFQTYIYLSNTSVHLLNSATGGDCLSVCGYVFHWNSLQPVTFLLSVL